jgi:hypothetical protein
MLVGESNCLRSLYPYHHSQEARNFLMLVGQSNCLRTLYPQDRVCSWITFRRASQNFYDTVINGMVISPFTPTSHPCNSSLQAPSTNACGERGDHFSTQPRRTAQPSTENGKQPQINCGGGRLGNSGRVGECSSSEHNIMLRRSEVGMRNHSLHDINHRGCKT